MSKQRMKFVAAGAAALILIVFVVVWRWSRSHARERASELLSASADLVRCVGGDGVEIERNAVDHAFHRRLVTSLPDIVPVSDCPQAMETVQEKFAAHQSVWFGSLGSSGKDGQPLGTRIKTAIDTITNTPFNVPANRALAKREQHAQVLKLPSVAMDLYQAVEELYGKEGADAQDVTVARDKRLRTARKVTEPAPKATQFASLNGKVATDRWSIWPGEKNQLLVHATTESGQAFVAATDNGGQKWDVASGALPIAGQQDPLFVAWYGPAGERWVVASHADPAKKARVLVGKLPLGAKALPTLTPVTDPPGDWTRAPGGEREVAVLPGGGLAYPVQRIAEKTAAQKKEQEKTEKYWQKHLNDKEVQAAIQLNDVRMGVRKAAGIDDDHFAMDGVAYVMPGKAEPTVRELPGYGLLSLVGGPEAQILLGKDALPAQVLYSTKLPPPEEPLGMMATATTEKMVTSVFRAARTFKCRGADGIDYGVSDRGLQLILMRPGSLEVTFMKVDVPDGTFVGCGEATAVVPLPFQPDRIFSNVLTIRGGEVEGAKIAMTSGTHIEEFNRTVATAVIQGAIVIAWVAEGYVQVVVSKNWGTEFAAPTLLGEALPDGSKISGVRVIGSGTRLFAVLAREKCAGNSCTTTFEMLVSDDQAKSWHGV
ncbi:MAG: hypothetical protein HY898_35565 [Deltaproteobacteria bacterium]|nr:hypothetical protein [Deltaproteobacteria bacterium]